MAQYIAIQIRCSLPHSLRPGLAPLVSLGSPGSHGLPLNFDSVEIPPFAGRTGGDWKPSCIIFSRRSRRLNFLKSSTAARCRGCRMMCCVSSRVLPPGSTPSRDESMCGGPSKMLTDSEFIAPAGMSLPLRCHGCWQRSSGTTVPPWIRLTLGNGVRDRGCSFGEGRGVGQASELRATLFCAFLFQRAAAFFQQGNRSPHSQRDEYQRPSSPVSHPGFIGSCPAAKWASKSIGFAFGLRFHTIAVGCGQYRQRNTSESSGAGDQSCDPFSSDFFGCNEFGLPAFANTLLFFEDEPF